MSQYTIQVDQFLVNTLDPEIKALTKSLMAMEPTGYNNKAIRETKRKLNNLIPIRDFLDEYAKGNEELDLSILRTLVDSTGLGILTTKSNQAIIQSSRSVYTPNIREYGGVIRIYKDDEILLTDTIPFSFTPFKITVFGENDIDKIEVTLIMSGQLPETYEGTKSVVIPSVVPVGTEKIVLEIKTYKNNKILTNKVMQYDIYFSNCTAKGKPIYWAGTTTERFNIPNDRHISSDITNAPDVTYQWLETEFDLQNRYIFDVNAFQIMNIPAGTVHALIFIPNTTNDIASVQEIVFGQAIDMQEGLHYDSIVLPDNPDYTCYYLRDLTDSTFTQDRQIQFNIVSI